MSQFESIKRMLIIINYIRSGKRYACQQDLLNDVNLSMKLRGFREITGKTLERDLKYIEEGFGLTIMFDKGARRYVIIDESTNDEKYEELLCNFDLLNELDKNSPIRSFVLAEHHRPPRSENMILLLKAIQYQHPIQFTYENYRKNTIELVDKTHPHYLKESQGRWYLLTKNNLALITYAVERMSDIEIFWDETFEREINIDVSELFRDCYGIWNSEKYPVEYIELRFSPLDGHFLKSLPLHHSQQILVDNDEEFRISLRMRITNDFVMTLLSRSNSITVIQPESLRSRLHNIYQEALARNEI